MSDNKEIAKRMARILEILAVVIEENPDLLRDIEFSLRNISIVGKKEKIEGPAIDFDVFQIFSDKGEQALRQKLELLDIKALKRIVRQHGFGSSKLAEKWKNKERLVNLIIERVAARSDKGKVFKDYS